MPKTYVLLDDDGQTLDSHVSFRQGALILHSRGGTKGKNARNADYSSGLRLLLGRLKNARLDIRAVWLDSNSVQSMPLPERELLSESEGHLEVQEIQRLLTSRMKTVRFDRGSTATGGNSTRRILIQTAFAGPTRAFAAIMKCVATDVDTGSYERLPVEQLNNVTAEHVWLAVEKFVAGNVVHAFGPSTDYDLIADDGSRHPPKAVFGVALAIAFPSVNVLPRHFAGGEGSTCFRLLRAAGFEILRKDGAAVPVAPEVMSWREGERVLKAHRVRERGRGLAKAKKAEFLRNHGRLFCQRCGEEPTTRFGTPHAEACIEVHHSSVQISEMGPSHRTTLADLTCLCANCHRLVHRLIQRGEIV
jgi:5-methylcytosine-specific restriction protein A